MTTILLFVGGYFVLLGVLSVLARPPRARLALLAENLICEFPEREPVVRHLLDSAYSIRSAPIQLLSFGAALLVSSERMDQESAEWAKKYPEIATDSRWGELFDCQTASVAAVNPLFGALLYTARAAFRMKAYWFIRKHHQPKQPKMNEIERYSELKAAA